MKLDPTCCTPLATGVDDADAEQLAVVFRALGDPARVKLLSMIAATNGESCVCDLVACVDLAQPTVSHHLKVLHRAGLVDREKRGTWAYYRVRRDTLDGLRRVLGDTG